MSGTPLRAEAYLAPETLAQLSSFELRARMVVEGISSGMHSSPKQGMAVEFAEHRPYTPGESLRHLDWKMFGRSDKLYIKRYQQETSLDVVILVDSSNSMRFSTLQTKSGWGGTDAGRSTNQWTKFDCAAAITVALAHLCLQQRDRVGLQIFQTKQSQSFEDPEVAGSGKAWCKRSPRSQSKGLQIFRGQWTNLSPALDKDV